MTLSVGKVAHATSMQFFALHKVHCRTVGEWETGVYESMRVCVLRYTCYRITHCIDGFSIFHTATATQRARARARLLCKQTEIQRGEKETETKILKCVIENVTICFRHTILFIACTRKKPYSNKILSFFSSVKTQ